MSQPLPPLFTCTTLPLGISNDTGVVRDITISIQSATYDGIIVETDILGNGRFIVTYQDNTNNIINTTTLLTESGGNGNVILTLSKAIIYDFSIQYEPQVLTCLSVVGHRRIDFICEATEILGYSIYYNC